MAKHTLKTLSKYWAALESGAKNFEVRINDRPGGFKVGDELELVEVDLLDRPDSDELEAHPTGRRLLRRVTYVLPLDWVIGVPPGWVVLGLEVCDG